MIYLKFQAFASNLILIIHFNSTKKQYQPSRRLFPLENISEFIKLFAKIALYQSLLDITKQLLPMSTNILSATISLIMTMDSSYEGDSVSNMEIAINILDEIMATSAKTVANHYDQLFSIFQMAMQPENGCSLRIMSLFADVIAQIVQYYPSLIRKNKNRLDNLIRSNLLVLSRVEFQVKEDWLTPVQGFDEEQYTNQNQDAQVERQMMKIFDQLASAIGYEFFLEHFKPIGHQWFNSNSEDWRFKNAVLMSMSQLGEMVQNVEQVEYFVNLALSCVANPHPKIRYALLHAIGQLSDDMKPKFQQKYTQKVLPTIIFLVNDPVQKVSSHAFACLTNFVEGYTEVWKLSPYLGDLMNKIVYCTKNGRSLIKQNAISTLGSLGTIPNLYNQNISIAFDVINDVLLNHAPEGIYDQLINQAFQAASILLQTQKKQYTLPYLNHYVNLFISFKDKLQSSYKMAMWSRLCIGFQNFIDLNLVYEDILKSAENSLLNQSEQDGQQSISAIQNTVRCFKHNFKPFIPITIEKIKNVLATNTNQSKIRQSCYGVLEEIIVSLKPQGPDSEWEILAKNTLSYFFSQISNQIIKMQEQDQDSCELEGIVTGIRNMIKQMAGLFNQNDVMALLTTVLNCSSQIEAEIEKLEIQIQETFHQKQNKDQNQEVGEVQGLDQLLKQLNHKLLQALLVIPDIFQHLLSISSSEVKIKLLEALLYKMQNYFQKSDELIRCGIYYIDNILESFQYSQISTRWSEFYNILVKFSTHPTAQLRNAAIFGLGLIFLKTPIYLVTQQNLIQWLQVLWSSLMISYNNNNTISYGKTDNNREKKRLYNFAKDNVVSALGKLLRTYYKPFKGVLNEAIFSKWIENLPLNEDKEEGNLQQSYLIEYIEKDPEIIVKNVGDLKRILQIFANFVYKRSKPLYAEQVQKTKKALHLIKTWPLFTQSVGYLWQNLSEGHKNILTKLTQN